MGNVLGPKFGINEIIDAMTQEIIENRAKEPGKYSPLRPSSAGKCERELGYEYAEHKGLKKYEKTSITPDVHRLLNLGYSIERHLLYEMEAAFKRLDKPFEIKYKQQALSLFRLHDGTLVEGNLDLVIVSDKFKMISDVKSKGAKYSSWNKSTWEDFSEKLGKMKSVERFGNDCYWIEDLPAFLIENTDAFFNQNLVQLNVYACSEFIKERGINCASIVQYNKNDSRLREIRFKPSDAAYAYVREKFQRVAEVVSRTGNPENLEREYTLGSAKCGFCSFNKQCWPEDNALKEHFKTYPPKRWPKDLDRLHESEQSALKDLFNEYERLAASVVDQERVEIEIIKVLDRARVRKLKLEDGRIYEVKRLKSGGPKGGAREVLRRGKL